MRLLIASLLSLGIAACSADKASVSSDVKEAEQASNEHQVKEKKDFSIPDGPETGLSGWNELVVTTRNLDDWRSFLTLDAGWEERENGPIDPALSILWNMPEDVVGTETVFANIGADKGTIRFVELEGIEQDYIRVDDRPWDTGGYFDFNVRVAGLNALREKMIDRGWQGDSQPIQYTFGPFEVIEWIARGPDGVRVAFIERLKPTLEGWPNLKVMSRVFNCTQMVTDMDAARAFFEGVLGMQTYLEHNGASKVAGPNVLGLPFETATQVPRDVYILHPQGVNDGSIELVKFEGASGVDLSSKAKAYNYGLSVARWPVEDLEQTIAAIKERGGEFTSDVVELSLIGVGKIKAISMAAPDGALIEIYQVID
ncbi:VOC family protein [Hirschia maritima]|uniref:VOC family protein n=1 Tax=Hirschia maritima TaxID=1121961 RepID=UPI0003806612|nr:VOC family protein [Hirschia maritima]